MVWRNNIVYAYVGTKKRFDLDFWQMLLLNNIGNAIQKFVFFTWHPMDMRYDYRKKTEGTGRTPGAKAPLIPFRRLANGQHLLTFHVQFVSVFHWKLIASTTIKDSYYFFVSLPNLIFSCHNLWIISLTNIQRYRNVARFVNDNPNDVIKLKRYFLIRNVSDSLISCLHIFKNYQLPNFLSFSDSFAVQEAFDLYRHSHSLDS